MWGGRVRRRLKNVLIHLHNYTAGRYCIGVGEYCIVVGEEVGLGGWGGIGGRINLLECCEGVIATAIAFAPSAPILLSYNQIGAEGA